MQGIVFFKNVDPNPHPKGLDPGARAIARAGGKSGALGVFCCCCFIVALKQLHAFWPNHEYITRRRIS